MTDEASQPRAAPLSRLRLTFLSRPQLCTARPQAHAAQDSAEAAYAAKLSKCVQSTRTPRGVAHSTEESQEGPRTQAHPPPPQCLCSARRHSTPPGDCHAQRWLSPAACKMVQMENYLSRPCSCSLCLSGSFPCCSRRRSCTRATWWPTPSSPAPWRRSCSSTAAAWCWRGRCVGVALARGVLAGPSIGLGGAAVPPPLACPASRPGGLLQAVTARAGLHAGRQCCGTCAWVCCAWPPQMSPGALVSFMLYQQSLSSAFQVRTRRRDGALQPTRVAEAAGAHPPQPPCCACCALAHHLLARRDGGTRRKDQARQPYVLCVLCPRPRADAGRRVQRADGGRGRRRQGARAHGAQAPGEGLGLYGARLPHDWPLVPFHTQAPAAPSCVRNGPGRGEAQHAPACCFFSAGGRGRAAGAVQLRGTH